MLDTKMAVVTRILHYCSTAVICCAACAARNKSAPNVVSNVFVEPTNASSKRATQPEVSAQEAEKMIRPVLAQGLHDLSLGKSTLGELVPSLEVEAPKQDARWNDIVAEADNKFSANPARRAVYLVMALKEGDPADRLDQLKLKDTGAGGSSGDNYVHFGFLKLADKPVEAGLQYYVDDRTHRLTARPVVSVDNASINRALYSLGFDPAMRLNFFERIISITGGGEIGVRADCLNESTHYEVARIDREGGLSSQDIDGPATTSSRSEDQE